MTNIVDCAQTQEYSDLGLLCLHIQFVKKVDVQSFRTVSLLRIYWFWMYPKMVYSLSS